MHLLTALLVLGTLSSTLAGPRHLRWCVMSEDEYAKCLAMDKQLEAMKKLTPPIDQLSVLPETFSCIRAVDVFECMRNIEDNGADIMVLDAGQGYFAGRYHNMKPFLAENYNDQPQMEPKYYAVAVFKSASPVALQALRGKRVCFPGIGMSAGWLYPISKMIDTNTIPVSECNAIVKSVTNFFGDSCLPGALSSFYNPFGNNPTSVCRQCAGAGDERCTTSDISANFDGAFRCLASDRGDLAFLRHDTVMLMANGVNYTGSATPYNMEDFRLLCPDGTTKTVSDYENCNWGHIPSHVVMTSAVQEPELVAGFKTFLLKADEWFRPGGTYYTQFQMFETKASYIINGLEQVTTRRNLMFSDSTRRLEDISDKTYYTWVGPEFNQVLENMRRCPLQSVRWCVTSEPEKQKCEDMIMALKAKDLRPELDCMLGQNTTDCMDLVAKGDADLINLDAGDVYLAGRKYNLVPIAAEDYGDMSMSFRVVAVARKTDKSTTLFNMKGKRSCQPGIGRGDGWIIPLNIYIETEQFLPTDCSIFNNIGQLFVRSCIPGALDKEYNPWQTPINLCEGCGANGFRKCMRNSEEQYYGASGAFRCLVEKGGDVSFVRHLTVRDNTDGRNKAIWSRNRRSDDYELMCKDGRRVPIDNSYECHLGIVPANTIVTAKFKSAQEREIFWNLLNYGQQFFSSDSEGDFKMFDSGTLYTDLMFTDAAVRLMAITGEKQDYRVWLGADFISQIENLQKYTCVSADAPRLLYTSTLPILVSLAMAIRHLFL